MNYDLIGTGSYSVVIKPFVKNTLQVIFDNSKDDKYQSNKYISKIFNDENKGEFKKELSILKNIIQIDDYINFTVPILQASTFDIKELENEIDILKKIDTPSSILYQIVFEYGGTKLDSKETNISLSFSSFMYMMCNFFEGIQKLHQANLVHRDIKPANVLYDKTKEKLNLIDFGLSCHVNDVYNKDDTYLLGYMYMYNPPEFYVASKLFENMQQGNNFIESIRLSFNSLKTYTKELEIFYYEHYYRYNRNEPYNIYSYKEGFNQFYNDIETFAITNEVDLFTKEFIFKSDVYSTAFILKSLKKHIIFENIIQREIFNELHNMTSSLNPFQRKSITEILQFIDDNLFY